MVVASAVSVASAGAAVRRVPTGMAGAAARVWAVAPRGAAAKAGGEVGLETFAGPNPMKTIAASARITASLIAYTSSTCLDAGTILGLSERAFAAA